jgi:prophage regulatory protein
MLLSDLTLKAYMDQQTVNVAVERRASSNRADVRFLRLKEVLAICGKSRSSVYDAIKKGDFPKPVKLSGRSSAWKKSKWNSGQSNAFAPADKTQDLETLRDRQDIQATASQAQAGCMRAGQKFVMTNSWSAPASCKQVRSSS